MTRETGQLIETEIITLDAPLREWVRKGTRFQQISKVIARIRRNYAKAFQIGALAKVANMSAASLHRHFEAVTRMSPLQYQKKIRLQEAWRLLIGHAGDAASIGFSGVRQFDPVQP